MLVLSSCEGGCYPLDLSLPHVTFLWSQAADTPAPEVTPPLPPSPTSSLPISLPSQSREGGRLGEPAAF